MAWPAPNSIEEFPSLPDSDKSTLDGDTVQVPNVAAYFSNNYREFAVSYYKDYYQKLNRFPFPPIRLNHPPEYAFDAIKKHTDSTYLEELVYPLRGSLYVNGFEPFYQSGEPKYWGATKFEVGEKVLDTKTTIRFYPSPLGIRILTWLSIVLSVALLWILGKRIIKNA